IFCRTTMPNGSRNDTGCAKGTPCCPTCAETRRCARGQLCCNGSCLTGDCCADGERPDPEKPICRGNICAACPSDARCGNGQRCGGQCKRGICCTDKECADRRCQAKSCTDNQCVYRPAADGEACNDNDPRTVGDVCRNGVCAGTPGAEVLQSARRHVHRRGRLLLCPRRADLHQWEMLRAGRVRLRRR
ncbi:MAG: hypothetical protein IT338_00385, partial [Thermomicrobiales bacterium]|nr:hypothetical protein [Thermomicrobiales bacterium]